MARSEYLLMPFEFFILFCAKIGFDTPYAIMNGMGVSVGASSPTLKRLEKKKLLTSTPGPRNRVSYGITELGETLLVLGLRAGPSAYGRLSARGLFDSLSRLIFFSWVKGDLEEAKSVLIDAHFKLALNAKRAEESVNECLMILQRPLEGDYERSSKAHIAAGYRLLDAFAGSILTQLQMESIPRLVKIVREMPPAPALHFRAVPDVLSSVREIS
jgi:DNA-binding PadR family transcriptional regulator